MATQDSRIRIKRSTVTTQVPTVAPSLDHTDGTWSANDIYVGELYANVADDRLFLRTNNGIREVSMYTPTANAMTVYHAKLTLNAAQIISGNTTPIPFGLTVPAGYYVLPLSGFAVLNYNSVTFDTGNDLWIRHVGATDQVGTFVNILTRSQDAQSVYTAISITLPDGLVTGADIEAVVDADGTVGNSSVTVYLTYLLIEA